MIFTFMYAFVSLFQCADSTNNCVLRNRGTGFTYQRLTEEVVPANPIEKINTPLADSVGQRDCHLYVADQIKERWISDAKAGDITQVVSLTNKNSGIRQSFLDFLNKNLKNQERHCFNIVLETQMKILGAKMYTFRKIPGEMNRSGDVESLIFNIIPDKSCRYTDEGVEMTVINHNPTGKKIDGVMFKLLVSRNDKMHAILSAPFIYNVETKSFDKMELGEWDIPTKIISAAEYEDITHDPIFLRTSFAIASTFFFFQGYWPPPISSTVKSMITLYE